MSDYELNKNANEGENTAPEASSFSSSAEEVKNANDSSSVSESKTEQEAFDEGKANTEASEKAAPAEAEPAEYTYSYGSSGMKENVTSRFNAPSDNTPHVHNEAFSNNRPNDPYAHAGNAQNDNRAAGAPYGQSAPYGQNTSYGQNSPYGQNASYAHGQVPPHTAQNSYAGQNPYGTQPPYGGQSPYVGQNPYAANGQHYSAPEHKAPEHHSAKKKKSGTVKTSTAILLCVACVVLSFAVSILGSALVYKTMADPNAASGGSSDGVVMYRDVETTAAGDASVSDIVDTVADSVVEITTEFLSNNNYFFGQYVSEGAGSGVIISEDGYIVTNNHVICNTNSNNKQADTIKVRLHNGTEYVAQVIGTDSDADIALIKIDATDLKAAVWGNSDNILVGEQVIAVGNPLGSLGGTLTVGYISAKSREVEIDNVKMTLIQTDAAVNPGNSGGGLFDLNGNLVGIVNAKSSGTGVEGLGFAIPANDAKETVEQLLEYGYVKGKVFIGVSFYEYNSGFYSSFGSSGMLMVYGVEEGYNDDVLKSGDIVLSVDGKEVSSVADVRALLKEHEVGDKITVSILRNKTAMDVEVECFEYNPSDSSVSFDQ